MNNDFSFQLLKLVISICAALVTAFVIPYIRTLRNDKRYAQMIDVVALAVRAAEQQITGSGTGPEKKERVVEFVKEWLGQMGVDYSYGQISELVEAAVWTMKQEQK